VLGVEAMTQVACAVTGSTDLPALERVEFGRPIVVPARGTTTIRVAALVREPGTVDVVIRSEETGFYVDHLSATCRFPRPEAPAGRPVPPLGPAADLLDAGPRCQPLLGYRRLGATRCTAEIGPAEDDTWLRQCLMRVLRSDTGPLPVPLLGSYLERRVDEPHETHIQLA
jgi:enediyne polyketide synthase